MSERHPKVDTRIGPVTGYRSGSLRVFKGIPYARPPVDGLRFRPPEPPQPWREPRDATRFGAVAIQPRVAITGPSGRRSEDCLTLNVWAPATPGPHPVLFWVHGGFNVIGASSQFFFDGRAFAEQGLVFVSANYRLGAFGFLELGSVLPALAGSGLNGLRDLVAALEWVRENIAAFGGDPGSVAIMGESAGAKNVCALMAIPSASGLFHRAAVQSGGGRTVYPSPEEAAPFTRAFLEAAGLGPGSASELEHMPPKAILKAQATALARFPRNFPIRPTVDGDFLPSRPIDAIKRGASARVDLVIGTCRDESALFVPPSKASRPIEARQLSNIDLPRMQAMEALYGEHFPDLDPSARRIRALTAEEYGIPSIEFAEAHAAAGGSTHMYRFDHATPLMPPWGYVPHGSDVIFTFDIRPLDLLLSIFAPGEASFMRRINRMWAGWASGRGPAIEGAPFWPAYDGKSRSTMLIDRVSQVVDDPNAEERRLWPGF